MFRADPDDLPEFLLQLHQQFGQQSDLLRVAKIGTQTIVRADQRDRGAGQFLPD